MKPKKLPNIGAMAAQMAANQSRIATAIDRLLAPLDSMVDASAIGDWETVAALGRQLARDSRHAGYRGISAGAQSVAREAAQPNNQRRAKQTLVRLIGTYGRTAQRES